MLLPSPQVKIVDKGQISKNCLKDFKHLIALTLIFPTALFRVLELYQIQTTLILLRKKLGRQRNRFRKKGQTAEETFFKL